MKRGLLCILFVVLLTVNVSAIVVSESTPVVLINEDFSKFVEGAETAPTEQDLADESTGAIDAQYTQQAGWSGMGIFQAGGICAIAPVYNYYFYEGGYLNTPKGDYSGVITYSFRARLQEGDQSKINVVMGEGYNTIDSYAHTLTTDWQTYTGEFKKGTFDRCFIQFSAGDEDKVLIDDIMVFDIDNLKGFLNDTSSFGFIAKENNKIIGFAYCYTLLRPDGKTMFYLHSIGMLPNYQDKGYGSKLLSFIKEYSKEIGCSEMFLITDKGNPRACHVYEKLGGKNDYKDEIVYVYDYEKGDK